LLKQTAGSNLLAERAQKSLLESSEYDDRKSTDNILHLDEHRLHVGQSQRLFSRPLKFLERVYPSQVAEVLGEQAEPSVVAQEPSQKTGASGPAD
jgi:hypothetical protein